MSEENIITVNTKQRIINLGTHIDEESAAGVVNAIILLSSQSDEDIDLYINSGGGSILHGLAIVNAIKLSHCHISGVVTGFAASMAAVIATCCDSTLICEDAYFMIHGASSGTSGKLQDMKDDVKFTERLNDHTDKLMSKATGIPIAKIKKLCEKDFWMDSKEAVELGFCDDILKGHKKNKSKLRRREDEKRAKEVRKAVKLQEKVDKEEEKTKVNKKTDDNKE